jgi:hypothetical protein
MADEILTPRLYSVQKEALLKSIGVVAQRNDIGVCPDETGQLF